MSATVHGALLHDILKASEYLADLFKIRLAFPDGMDCAQPSDLSIPMPPCGMSLTSMAEYELLATALSRAYRSPIMVPWDVQAYCNRLPPRPNGFDSSVEDDLLRMFPALHQRPFPAVVRPSCIVDVNGVILCWYLPSCLTFERQTKIWNATRHLQPYFLGGRHDGNWRNLDVFFRPMEDCLSSSPGTVNLSPGWFDQAQDGPSYDLKASASLNSKASRKGGRDWLSEMAESSTILSSILRVIHPELFKMGLDAMRQMSNDETLKDVLDLWWSVFNGAQVISNRETPVHRDHSSLSCWYDILTTVGPYKTAYLELPGVGLRFSYGSGTVVGLCGRVLRHGVSLADGERICVAYFMRENVQRRLGSKFASWNFWDNYRY